MLADQRKKQKLSVDPRNKAWTDDDSKFGQKLMEQMGWSKGRGLGRNGTGIVDPVKVSCKSDKFGVGCTVNYADNWIAHQDDFDSLLKQLNDGEGEKHSDHTVVKLEDITRKSKGRAHCLKFSKGKDLSVKTNTDLNCIFGRRKKVDLSPEIASSAPGSDIEDMPSLGIKTIKSEQNLQEYFAHKMAALKNNKKCEGTTSCNLEKEPENLKLMEQDNERTVNNEKRKVTKRKREKELDANPNEVGEEHDTYEHDGYSVDSAVLKRKRKKKSKHSKNKVIIEKGGEEIATNEANEKILCCSGDEEFVEKYQASILQLGSEANSVESTVKNREEKEILVKANMCSDEVNLQFGSREKYDFLTSKPIPQVYDKETERKMTTTRNKKAKAKMIASFFPGANICSLKGYDKGRPTFLRRLKKKPKLANL